MRDRTRIAWAQLSLFLVPVDAPGLARTAIEVEVKSAERQWALFFDDVVVESDALLGAEGDGLRQLFHGLNPERIFSASVWVALARSCLDKGSPMRTSGLSGTGPSAPTRACRIRWPGRRSHSRRPG